MVLTISYSQCLVERIDHTIQGRVDVVSHESAAADYRHMRVCATNLTHG